MNHTLSNQEPRLLADTNNYIKMSRLKITIFKIKMYLSKDLYPKNNIEASRSYCLCLDIQKQGTLTEGEGSVQLTSSLS
jgi:hypothetical protein